MTKKEFKDKSRRLLDPFIGALAAASVPPLLVSVLGLALSIYGAMKAARGELALGGLFLLLSGLCDVIDGSLARRMDVVSRFGAFIDSTFDRVTELAYFGAILFYYVNRVEGFHPLQVIVILTALAGSLLTSYARARAEGLGLECTVGMFERPERLFLLIVGLLLGSRILMMILVFLAVSTMLTFLQRILHVYKSTR
jgi:CDP-diacylglycerol--glycerol-3-phosphate 3-phosphatidyltransferase